MWTYFLVFGPFAPNIILSCVVCVHSVLDDTWQDTYTVRREEEAQQLFFHFSASQANPAMDRSAKPMMKTSV